GGRSARHPRDRPRARRGRGAGARGASREPPPAAVDRLRVPPRAARQARGLPRAPGGGGRARERTPRHRERALGTLRVRARGDRMSSRRKDVAPVAARELESLRAAVKRGGSPSARWNADPDDVQRSVVRLVLALVEFLRKLMERQAIRRMEAGTLTPE